MMIKSLSWIAASSLLVATLGACSSVEQDSGGSTSSPDDDGAGTDGDDSAPPTTASASGTQGGTMSTDGTTGSDTDDPSTTTVDPVTGTTGTTDPGSTSDPTSGSSGETDSNTDSSSTGVPETVTIYDIQQGDVDLDEVVTVDDAIVTAIAVNGFWAQAEAGGQFSGIFVFTGDDGPDISTLALGDEVIVTGAYQEFFEASQINAAGGTVEISASPGEGNVPAPEVIAVADVGEPWESVFIRVEQADPAELTITEVNPMMDVNEFTVEDGAMDTVVIDDFIYDVIEAGDFSPIGVGATFDSAQGPLNFGFGAFKIVPRMSSDLTGFTAA